MYSCCGWFSVAGRGETGYYSIYSIYYRVIFEDTYYVHNIIIVEIQYCDNDVLASANKLTCNKNGTKIKSSPILILRFLH